MRMNYSKFLYVVAFATVLFTACGNDSSTSANNSNDGDNSSKSSSSSAKSSSSRKKVSSSSNKVTEPVEVTVGSMKDSRDGQKYKTAKIGKQTWMAQNLNYKTANSYCYDDNASNCSKYGRLYTWAAAMDSAGTFSTNGKGCSCGETCSPTYPVRGVCPDGWHLPTETEWESLFTAVGGRSTAGEMLKSTFGWESNGIGTDAFSFSALPAGWRYNYGVYDGEGDDAGFWSSTEGDSENANLMGLDYVDGYAGLYYGIKNYGFSVRCLKD